MYSLFPQDYNSVLTTLKVYVIGFGPNVTSLHVIANYLHLYDSMRTP